MSKIRKITSWDALPPVVEAQGEFFSTRILEDRYRRMEALCKDVFENPFVRRYAGANEECLFCGSTRKRDGSLKHERGCAYVRWMEIKQCQSTSTKQ